MLKRIVCIPVCTFVFSYGLGCGVDTAKPDPVGSGATLSEAGSETDLDFVDVSYQAGVRDNKSQKNYRSSYGPLWGDLNGDGALDLLFMNHGRTPGLWVNQADGTFRNVFGVSGLRYGNPAYFHQWDRHGCACADYDNDGDLDLFISHGGGRGRTLGEKSDELLRQDGATFTFEDVTSQSGTRNSNGRARFPTWVDVDNDGFLDLYIGNAETPNALYRNNGDGTFSDITAAAGLGLVEENRHSWTDFDGDGDLDLIALPPLRLYRNDGDAGFALVDATVSGLRGKGKSVTIGDFDSDGQTDFFLTAIFPAKNRLFRNSGGRFKPVDGEFGPEDGEVCKGAVWGDLDNDGNLDLVVGCSDGLRLVQNRGRGDLEVRELRFDSTLAFESDADVALGDFDNDGFLDLATVSAEGNHLLRNTAHGGSWLRVLLRGTSSNRMGFGAKVTVDLQGGRKIHSEYIGDTGFFGSAGCGPLHIGLGDSESIDAVVIQWPSGTVQRLLDVAVNQVLEVIEPS
jgi:hypothetical protein